jgi:hypothetical protein
LRKALKINKTFFSTAELGLASVAASIAPKIFSSARAFGAVDARKTSASSRLASRTGATIFRPTFPLPVPRSAAAMM